MLGPDLAFPTMEGKQSAGTHQCKLLLTMAGEKRGQEQQEREEGGTGTAQGHRTAAERVWPRCRIAQGQPW